MHALLFAETQNDKKRKEYWIKNKDGIALGVEKKRKQREKTVRCKRKPRQQQIQTINKKPRFADLVSSDTSVDRDDVSSTNASADGTIDEAIEQLLSDHGSAPANDDLEEFDDMNLITDEDLRSITEGFC